MIAVGQLFFAHVIPMDSGVETATCLGRMSLVVERGVEPANAANLDLAVKPR